MNSVILFQDLAVLRHICFAGEGWQLALPGTSQEGIIYTTQTLKRVARKITKAAKNSALGVNETSEWCNSFLLVPETNSKI